MSKITVELRLARSNEGGRWFKIDCPEWISEYQMEKAVEMLSETFVGLALLKEED